MKNRKPHHNYAPYGKPTPTYNSWNSMKSRCLNPNADNFTRYGGRGVGETKPISIWSKELHIARKTIRARLSEGMSHEKALGL